MQVRDGITVGQDALKRFRRLVPNSEIGANATDCNLWRSSRDHGTWYGRFDWNGKGESAHRISYRWFIGEIPPLKQVLHTCGNVSHGGCVNPHHLKLGGPKENSEDRILDGTQHRGEKTGSARLTEATVRDIFENKGKISQDKRALKHGVSKKQIANIDGGSSWTHVTGMPLSPAVARRNAQRREKTRKRKLLEEEEEGKEEEGEEWSTY